MNYYYIIITELLEASIEGIPRSHASCYLLMIIDKNYHLCKGLKITVKIMKPFLLKTNMKFGGILLDLVYYNRIQTSTTSLICLLVLLLFSKMLVHGTW